MEWKAVVSRVRSLQSPGCFLGSDTELKNDCISILSDLFGHAVKNSSSVELPLSELYTQGFELEDIWEQLELVNEPLLKKLKQYLGKTKRRTSPIRFIDEKPDKEEEEDIDELSETEEVELEDTELEEMMENDVGSDAGDSNDDDVRMNIDHEAKDQFFNLSEMTKYLDAADQEELEGNDSDTDSIDLFTEEAGEEMSEEDDKDDSEPRYRDFFDPPPSCAISSDVTDKRPLTPFEKRQKKMKEQIEWYEAANLANLLDKPWQMRGEVTAKDRPENSLLQEDLVFEHVTCPPPEITEEVTYTLESMIKERIRDKAWNDVVRKVKPKEKPYNYQVERPLDQEKSKLSLAEVYEQEYIQHVQEDREDKEDPKHIEIKEIMDKLFRKLDALANFHFTPKMPETDIKTIPINKPSIVLEEVLPVSQSDTTLLAPEEIQANHRVEIGKTERSDTDKKRARRKKKLKQKFISQIEKKKNRHKAVDETKILKKNSSPSKVVRSSDKFFDEFAAQVKIDMQKKKEKREKRQAANTQIEV